MKILVIDDDPDIADMVSLAIELRWPDARISIAESGESGLAKLDAGNPDLIILDIGLPGIDGYEVITAIRSVSAVPVIMLTAREDQGSVTRALDLGADDSMTKPFSTSILLAGVQALIREYQRAPPDRGMSLPLLT